MHPILKDTGMVHIWYYIPLCTILLRNPMVMFSGPISMIPNQGPQAPSPILKEDSSAHQSGNPWRLSEDHFRTPTTWPCRSLVGNSSRIIPRAILRGYSSLNQLSRQQVLQYSLDNSIDPYRKQSINLYVFGPIGPLHIPLWEFNHTVQFSRWPELYWPNSDNTAG
ncbi:hypothetical protein O181_128501 [Austropuccinia psidii MF-1]|uniref:Uncharacterized protein n=1 Tax=Austropuccinia psidii MF-1 TaxID=1389203 RepID=A0A9Q3Q7R2_9BASI|nr:hypothetical protein [Austropuccinia psidii MF-1]